MAFDPWDDINPTNTESVSLGASRIRELAARIKERFESIIVDIDDDPWVFKAALFDGAVVIDGPLTVIGTVTAAGFTGPATVAASAVTAGTFAAGNFIFPDNLTVQDNLVVGGTTNFTGAVTFGGGIAGTITSATITTLSSDTINGSYLDIPLTATAQFFSLAVAGPSLPSGPVEASLPAITNTVYLKVGMGFLGTGYIEVKIA